MIFQKTRPEEDTASLSPANDVVQNSVGLIFFSAPDVLLLQGTAPSNQHQGRNGHYKKINFEILVTVLIGILGKNKINNDFRVILILIQAPRHEEVWESGSIAPRILNLCSRWSQLHASDALPLGKDPQVSTGYETGWPHIRCKLSRRL
jgi:hypothetical protein